MGTEDEQDSGGLAGFISIGKDLVSLLRDGALFMLAILLVLFPAQFNSILTQAGFQEGSIAGFKWKQNLVDSNDELEKAQVTIAGLQSQNEELVKTLEEVKHQLEDEKLQQRIAEQADQSKKQQDQARIVQSTVSKTLQLNAPLVEKALAASDRALPHQRVDFTVGLQTVGIPDEEREDINRQLHTKYDYGLDDISWSYPAGERPSWFAYKSTVFYYSASSRLAAKELAEILKTITGEDFGIQRGAGLGVDPDRKDVTLFAHYIKP